MGAGQTGPAGVAGGVAPGFRGCDVFAGVPVPGVGDVAGTFVRPGVGRGYVTGLADGGVQTGLLGVVMV